MARLMGTSLRGPAYMTQKAPFDSREGFNFNSIYKIDSGCIIF